MNRSAEADALFDKIQECKWLLEYLGEYTLIKGISSADGVVAIDTEWALVHGLAPSLPHPQDTAKSIYQIDMFHSMHCVVSDIHQLGSRADKWT